MKTSKLTEGSPFRAIVLLALPMICSNLFQQLYNVLDSVIVGRKLGQDALAAVGSSSSITAVFVQLAMGLALGASIVISQYFGAGKTDRVRICATTSVLFSLAVGLVSTIVMWIFAEPILRLVNTPEEILSMSVQYLRFYFLGSIPIFVYNALNSIYTALGNSRLPLVFLVISSIVNVVLDLAFILVFRWGVGGAAVSTAIAQTLAMILALLYLPGMLRSFPEHEGSHRLFDWKILGTVLKFALPSALQQSIVSVGSVVVQSVINSFGSAVIAGSAAATKIFNLVTAVPINYSNAYSHYVGQNMGAGRVERIWPGLKSSLLCCGGVCLVMTAVMEIYAEPLLHLFITKTESAEDISLAIMAGTEYIHIVGGCLTVFAVFLLIKATFKGSGDMSWFIFTTLLSFFIRLGVTVGLTETYGVTMIWWAFNIGWIISLIVAAARYVQGGWKYKVVIKEGK